MKGNSLICAAFFAVLLNAPVVSAVEKIKGQSSFVDALFEPQAHPIIAADLLRKELRQRMDRVAELKFIREIGERNNLKIYLFGGTAAGYAHYVNWDLRREAGDSSYQPDRFDYEFSNIYRSTQDLDIVIDGSQDDATMIEKELESHFPHITGSKTSWEVRLLREKRGSKLALLNNPDFLNQHTDSNSVGLVEVTQYEPDHFVVRDLRDWDNSESHFFNDIRESQLSFYFSPSHEQTSRSREGLNPPIFSVIRYLTKVFQYELSIKQADFDVIKKIIDRTDFSSTYGYSNRNYLDTWLETNAKKMFLHAANLDLAAKVIDLLGIVKKLQEREAALNKTLNFLNREPLHPFELGRGDGKTAAELKIDTVAHDTMDFLAYESITRSHKGFPNVFISRNGKRDEAAAYGDGFYTRIGRVGAKDTGITIRFKLKPEAREGSDFLSVGDDYIVVTNRNAFEVIQETLHITPMTYIQLFKENKLEAFDKGVLYKLNQKVKSRIASLSKEDRANIVQELREQLQAGLDIQHPNRWHHSKMQTEFIHELLNFLSVERGSLQAADEALADFIDVQPTIDRMKWIVQVAFTNKFSANFHRTMKTLVQKGNFQVYQEIFKTVFTARYSVAFAQDLRSILKKYKQSNRALDLSLASLAGAELLLVLENNAFMFVEPLKAKSILDNDDHPSQNQYIIESRQKARNQLLDSFVQVLQQPYSQAFAGLLEDLLKLNSSDFDQELIKHVYSQLHWNDREDDLLYLLSKKDDRTRNAELILKHVLKLEEGKILKTLIRDILSIRNQGLIASLVDYVFNRLNSNEFDDLIEDFFEVADSKNLSSILKYLIRFSHGESILKLIDLTLKQKDPSKLAILRALLVSDPGFGDSIFDPLREILLEADVETRADLHLVYNRSDCLSVLNRLALLRR